MRRRASGEVPDAGDERLRLLRDLWDAARGDQPAPTYAQFDVLERPEWRGHLSLLEAVDGGTDFHYRVYGSALAAYYGRDLTGKTTRTLSPAVGNLVRREYAEAYMRGRPMLVERRRRVRGVSINIAKLILPLSSDGKSVDLLLAASYPHP
jgi:hypothetical protein